jgi:hypothetical protein
MVTATMSNICLSARSGFALEWIDLLGFPVFDDNFRAFGSALAEYLLDLFARLLNGRDQSRNHLGEFEAIVLMQCANEW